MKASSALIQIEYCFGCFYFFPVRVHELSHWSSCTVAGPQTLCLLVNWAICLKNLEPLLYPFLTKALIFVAKCHKNHCITFGDQQEDWHEQSEHFLTKPQRWSILTRFNGTQVQTTSRYVTLTTDDKRRGPVSKTAVHRAVT